MKPYHKLTKTSVIPMDMRSSQYGLAAQLPWDYEKSLLLIVEIDLSSRFPYVEQVLCRDKHVLQLKNVTKRNLLNTLINRFSLRKEVSLAYEDFKKGLSKYRFIFLSNTEGFIAKNIVRWIRKDFPSIILLNLQHGIFMLENNRKKRSLIFCLNKLTEAAVDYSVAGEGIINNCVDFYIVYNQYYKSLLISGGVFGGKVIISSLFLKGEKFFKSGNTFSSLYKNNALFLLQCLSALAITDRKTEAELMHAVVAWLSKQYDFVLLKQHPYCNIELSPIPNNCKFVEGEISEIAKECGTAVSFFSEALHECEYLGLRTIAIRSKSLKVKPEVYDLFESVADIQEDGSVLMSSNGRVFSKYYESEIVSPDELSNILVGFQNTFGK